MSSERASNATDKLPHALDHITEIYKAFKGRKPVLFLDYDGTLSPIVSDPHNAVMSAKTKRSVAMLGSVITVAIVSGRDRKDVEQRVDLPDLIYAGSHGFDIKGPDNMNMQYHGGEEVLPYLERAERNLLNQLKEVSGVWVERKKYAIAVHYRNVAEENIAKVFEAVDDELANQGKLKKGSGKKILELKPNIDWHKGKAVLWLMEALNFQTGDYIPVFIGDDITDEDALQAVEQEGIGILVGSHGEKTAASFQLNSIDEVTLFLENLYENCKV